MVIISIRPVKYWLKKKPQHSTYKPSYCVLSLGESPPSSLQLTRESAGSTWPLVQSTPPTLCRWSPSSIRPGSTSSRWNSYLEIRKWSKMKNRTELWSWSALPSPLSTMWSTSLSWSWLVIFLCPVIKGITLDGILYIKKPQKLSGTIPFLTKGPMALFFGGKTEDNIS